jgi:hypothetical protein
VRPPTKLSQFKLRLCAQSLNCYVHGSENLGKGKVYRVVEEYLPVWRSRSRRNSKAKCDGFAQLVRSRSYRSESESSYASMRAPSVTQTSKQNLRSSHAPVTLMSKTVPPDCGASKAFAYSPTSKSIAEISMSLPPTIVFTSAWQPAACPDKPQR